MRNRNPLPLWIIVSIFLAAVSAVPLTCQLRSRPATPPTVTELHTLTELAELLSQDAPDLQVVSIAKYGSVETGFYLCNDSRSWRQLSSVTRSCKDAAKWQGVVYCERVGENNSSIPEREIQQWGEQAMRIGPFLFFGDSALLRRIDHRIQSCGTKWHIRGNVAATEGRRVEGVLLP